MGVNFFNWVAKSSTFPTPQFCCCVKEQRIFVDLLQIKEKFYCQESIIIPGLSAYERA